MKTTKSMALAGVMATALAAAGPADARDVKIGGLYSMTGDLQTFGPPISNGMRLAVKEINADGGVLGEDLTYVIGDTQTLAQPGIDAANRLASVENVAAIVGALASGVTIPVARSVARERGIPQVSPSSTSPVVTNVDDDGYLFRTVPSDALQGTVLANIAHEKGYRSVSIMYINNDYGEGLSEAFGSRFVELGGEVLGTQPFEPDQASYRGELSQLAHDDAEALVLIAYPQNGLTILRQSLEEGFFDDFIFTDGMKAVDIAQAIGGGFLDGTFGTAPSAPEGTEAQAHFRAAYEAEFGELPPQPYIDAAYDATYVIALAMEQAGSTDGEAIRDALNDVANPPGIEIGPGEWAKAKEAIANGEAIDYNGITGSVDFDENGDVPGSFEHWIFDGDGVVTVEIIEDAG